MTDYAPPPPDAPPMDGPDDAELAEFERQRKFNVAVFNRMGDLQITDEARRRIRAEERAKHPRPHLVRLDEFLARPYDDPTYRIAEVWPTGGRVVLSAQFKAGKTTVVGNVLRALVDGLDLFDRFAVAPGARVALIDDELDPRTLQRWLADQDIENQADVRLVPIRGQLETFDIRDPDLRTEWAADLAGVDVIILDCLRPILDALGLDENREAGRFLVAFDALLAEAGASEALVLHHMGHTGERSRGDSRIQDWPDALWKLVRDKDEENPDLDDLTGSRYFSAIGRDVQVTQAELTYDPTTRRLTLGTQARNRRQATVHRRIVKADEAVMTVVTATPGINKTNLRTAVRDQHGIGRNEDIDAAVERLVDQGLITRHKAGNTHLHYPGEKTLEDLVTDPHLPDLPNVPQDPLGTRADMCPPLLVGAPIDTPPTADTTDTCPHGMPHGHEPDPFVSGRLACPQCALEASA